MIRLAALAGISGISFSAIFMRLASPSPAAGAFWRAAYALPLLVPAWLAIRRRDHRDRRARLVAFAAGVLLAADLTVWQMSIDRIGAGLAVVLANVQVIVVGAAAWALHRERPTAAALAVVPVVLAGIALISGLGRDDAYGTDPILGAVLGVATAFTYAAFLLVFRQSNRRHLAPAPGPILDATAGTAAGALVFGLLDPGFTLAVSWPQHGWLIALGVVVQAFGWTLISVALPRLAALDTSVLLLLQPTLALLWARLIFAEALSPMQWAGAVLVLGGILVLVVRGTVEAPQVTPAAASADPGS